MLGLLRRKQIQIRLLPMQRYGRMIAESPYGFNESDQFNETFEKFKPIINYFLVAFKQNHGKFDEEYLDSFEILLRLRRSEYG
jgi:hypothetical protein